MASMKSTLDVSLEYEKMFKIVELQCCNSNCAHNLCDFKDMDVCNLKHVEIDKNGKCRLFLKRDE